MQMLAKNRRAHYDYEIEQTLTAGVVLSGPETKSVRAHHVSLKGSFARLKAGELWLFNAHITPYSHTNPESQGEPTQPRKLLVKKRELDMLKKAADSGRAIVPLAFLGGRFIKMEVGIGRGKKKYDKRQAIKKREAERAVRP